MNRRDRERLVVMSLVKAQQLRRRKAAELLGLSLQQMHRLYLRYLAEGDGGLLHKRRGRASNRRISHAQRERALALYLVNCAGDSVHAGFGPTLFAEKLGVLHGLYVSHDTVRRWMLAAGLLVNDLRRWRRSRRRRLRKARFGEMVQMDGSEHDWLEGRGGRCVLMVIVDDATGRKQGLFYSGKTLAAAMDVLGRWCERYGVPQSVYVDQAGMYRCEREPTTSDFRCPIDMLKPSLECHQ